MTAPRRVSAQRARAGFRSITRVSSRFTTLPTSRSAKPGRILRTDSGSGESGTSALDLRGEVDALPARVLVHEPSATGVFRRLRRTAPSELEARYLFRAVPDPEAFAREHDALTATLRSVGTEIVYLRDVVGSGARRHLEENPNHVYTRDSAITLPWLPNAFIRGAMRKAIRRREPDVMASALEALGLDELVAMPAGSFLEGGDVIPIVLSGKRTLLVGFGPRTAEDTLATLYRELAPESLDQLVAIELVPERMNLDGALVPVAHDVVLVDPSSIVRSFLLDERGRRGVDVIELLRLKGFQPLVVTRREATELQACNCVCLGERRVVAYDLCRRALDELRDRDVDVLPVPGSELIKGTGGPRCMTRPLYR